MKVATALILGYLLRTTGGWLCTWGYRVEQWAGVEPIKAGGTSSD